MTYEPDDRFGGPVKLAGQNRIRLVAIGFSIAFLAIVLQLTNLTILKGIGVEDDTLADICPACHGQTLLIAMGRSLLRILQLPRFMRIRERLSMLRKRLKVSPLLFLILTRRH